MVIMVDDRGITVHPHGVSVAANQSIISGGEAPVDDDPLIPSSASEQYSRPAGTIRVSAPRITSGDIEVKLLTVVPLIEGLPDGIPAKRARRAIEVVAYLAIHHPDPISSDRLRTRVLGSHESDAAAKTLFNTVGAARRAMGSDIEGQLYFPNASRYGHYRLSDLVTVDASRVSELLASAKNRGTADEAIALYRSAFDLIKGEPLAGVLSGYAWWRSEGHEARLTASIVDAACRAVHLAVGEGYLDLAWWILDRSRLVDPYSELLSRAAMATAAAGGDLTRLRREWDECRRRISELDTDSFPSRETERLFEQLSRRSSGPNGRHASFAAIDEAP